MTLKRLFKKKPKVAAIGSVDQELSDITEDSGNDFSDDSWDDSTEHSYSEVDCPANPGTSGGAPLYANVNQGVLRSGIVRDTAPTYLIPIPTVVPNLL